MGGKTLTNGCTKMLGGKNKRVASLHAKPHPGSSHGQTGPVLKNFRHKSAAEFLDAFVEETQTSEPRNATQTGE